MKYDVMDSVNGVPMAGNGEKRSGRKETWFSKC